MMQLISFCIITLLQIYQMMQDKFQLIKLVKLFYENKTFKLIILKSGWTPLIIAASAGHLKVIEMLIAKGVDVNCCTDGGHSALQYAASRDRHEIVELLLHHHADPNKKDDRGATPLHRAGKSNTSHQAVIFMHTNNGRNLPFFICFKQPPKGI